MTTLPQTTILTTIPKTTIMTTLPQTTILTTIPKTTIMTTLPQTTILTTIPKTTIMTTLPQTTILTTIPKTTIMTTLPQTTILTTLPKTTILTSLLRTTMLTPKTTILPYFPKTTIIIAINHCLDKDNYISHDSQKDIYFHYCPNYSRESIKGDLNDIVHRIDNLIRYSIQAKDFVAKIAPIDYTVENENTECFAPSTYVNFTECEKILRAHYTILSPRKITFVQVEIENSEDNILVNQIEYQAYDDEKNNLNLSLCEIKNIEIYYSFKDATSEKMDYISLFRNKGIDILDINDNFFNDICLPYSESDKDLTLNDRRENIYKNYTFCEQNCELEEILFDEMAALCNCSVKNNLNVKDINFDLKKYEIVKKPSNFKIIKCYDSFLAIKDNLNNLGFWIFLTLILLNIIFFILFCCLGVNPFKAYMGKSMAKFGYIREQDEGHAFCHNYEKKLNKLLERLKQLKDDYNSKNEREEQAPPKRKVREISSFEENSKGTILKKDSNKKLRTKNKIKTDIEQLKKRMEKTRKKTKIENGNSNSKITIYTKTTKDKITENDKNKLLFKKNKYSINTENSDVEKNKKSNNDSFDLHLMNINISDLKKPFYVPNESKYILNIYDFEDAKKYDKRRLCTIYYIFLISKQIIMHTLFYKSPIEIFPIRFSLLIFLLSCDLALNNIFYTDDKISDKYNSLKNIILLAFTSNLIIILLSTLIGYVFLTLFASLNNSTNQIRKIFRKEEEKIKKNKKYIVTLQRKKEILSEVKKIMNIYKCKIVIIYILQFIIMFFYFYYATIFCYIYNRTQISWLFDSIITIVFRVIVDLLISLVLSMLYINSVSCENSCFFSIIIFFYCFG